MKNYILIRVRPGSGEKVWHNYANFPKFCIELQSTESVHRKAGHRQKVSKLKKCNKPWAVRRRTERLRGEWGSTTFSENATKTSKDLR